MSDNVERTRRGYEAFARGDLDAIRDLLAPDIVWHVPGRSTLAGDYRGIDAVLTYFGELFTRSAGTFSAELIECGEIAPDLVACLVRIRGDMTAASVDSRVVQLFQQVDGRTAEVWSLAEDQYAIDEAEGATEISLPEARAAQPAST